jgi:hypothetical protein
MGTTRRTPLLLRGLYRCARRQRVSCALTAHLRARVRASAAMDAAGAAAPAAARRRARERHPASCDAALFVGNKLTLEMCCVICFCAFTQARCDSPCAAPRVFEGAAHLARRGLPQAVSLTPCGHSFCKECILLALDKKRECPVGRCELPATGRRAGATC